MRELSVSRPKEDNKDNDFCVNFLYNAKDSPLVVSANLSLHEVQIPNSVIYPQVVRDKEWEENAQICASWLTNEVKNVDAFYFKFPKKPITAIDSNYVILMTTDSITNSANVFKGNDNNYTGLYGIKGEQDFKSFFINNGDNFDGWTFNKSDPVGMNNRLILKIDADDLYEQKLYGDVATMETSLRSKWIKMPNNNKEVRLGFDYLADKSDKDKISEVEVLINTPERYGLIRKSLSVRI